ncbi:MFS general substrate transporter [Delitschia confertaspora ATCC 74209]|uniref:MFS general substrate transporter n=1 Tax=Delitschia confertaspora ATCC 74209 TaxID=1513339 RepID=A0A9P4JS90_9PLEO|nr:MFS general substrate transporter [Delitschia confertaspora ATCC 74209]
MSGLERAPPTDNEKALGKRDYLESTSSIESPTPTKEKQTPSVKEKEEDATSIIPSHTSTIDSEAGHDQPRIVPTLSRRSTVTPDAIVVDRKSRRGLFATLTLIPEVENPFHYARKTKWFLTIVVAFCGMAAPMGSAIVMPALHEIALHMHASTTITNLSVAVYMLSMAIFPLWWSSFSETTGRRTIYIISFALFVLWAILSAVSTNIAMLIVMRTLSGGAAASVQAVGAGTIADIWEVKERGRAMGIFYLGPLCGPLLAPIFGGALTQGLGWRSTQWFLVIYGGLTLIFIIFGLPETLRARRSKTVEEVRQTDVKITDISEKTTGERPNITRVSTRQSVHQKTKSILSILRRIFLDPLLVLRYLRYPAISLTVYYASITFGSLYFLNISLQASFSKSPYNFSTVILGLLYIPNSIGYFLASISGGPWIDRIMMREARKAGRYDEDGKLVFLPEDRMRENAWIAAVMWPGALLVYGWTVQEGVHWIVPMLTNFIFGLGSMLIFSLSTTMLTEFMPKRASSGIAINNFVRNICSFIGAVAAEPIIDAIGNGWIFTIIGIWSLGSGLVVIWLMQKRSAAWREAMGEGGIGG